MSTFVQSIIQSIAQFSGTVFSDMFQFIQHMVGMYCSVLGTVGHNVLALLLANPYLTVQLFIFNAILMACIALSSEEQKS